MSQTSEASEATAVNSGGGQQQTQPEGRKQRKVREGYVVSDKMDKTVVVALEDRKKHPLYGKVMRSTTKVKAHDEENTAGVGDRVLLMETRPLSATKRWRLVQILEKAK
ncbi:MAG TPA: 30S ribosomal protein S17 [Pseudonocardiaceae bacterium]|nr:30S ribosomal protein S17 [Pseudonocardiaceae bacterium]